MAAFLSDLFIEEEGRQRYGTDSTAMLLMADHGMYTGNEFRIGME